MFFSNTSGSDKNKYLLGILTTVLIVIAITLRSIGLLHTPPSLYWEEVALGYDAYSILKTGADHHGNPWPIVAFESFGDWKPSLYFYTIVPFIAAFGLEPWVIRIPSVLAGIAIVVAVGLLTRKSAQLFELPLPNWYGLIGLFVASISSWAIHFSRGGWEVNLATALVSWGMTAGVYAASKSKNNFRLSSSLVIASTILLLLAVYAYHGTRLISPFLGFGLAIYWFLHLLQNKKFLVQRYWSIAFSGVVAIVLLAPLLISLNSPQVSQRFAETSIFSELSVIEQSNQFKKLAGDTIASKLFFHRYVLFSKQVAINYLSHFNFDFLFISGDSNPRHSSRYGGHLYYQEALFLVIGVGLVLTKKKKVGWLLLFWWLTAIIPASLTKATPHALRILPAMPVMLIIVSLGIGQSYHFLVKLLTTKKLNGTVASALVSAVIVGSYLISFSFWWRNYWLIYPKQTSSEWQYGYQQMVLAIQMEKSITTMPIYITREQGRSAMYYWFFTKTDPRKVQAENSSAKKDQGEYLSFDSISFPNTTNEIVVDEQGALVASSESGLAVFAEQGFQTETIATISDELGEVVWQVYTVKP